MIDKIVNGIIIGDYPEFSTGFNMTDHFKRIISGFFIATAKKYQNRQ